VLLAAVEKGADRQEMHEVLRQLSMAAWQALERGEANPLAGLVTQNERVTHWVTPADLVPLFAVEAYTGIAESRAREMAEKIRSCIHKSLG
jgi:adenylosuccinate lyase